MKKKIAMILAMALSLTTLLSACSGTQAKEGDKSSGEKTTVEKSAEDKHTDSSVGDNKSAAQDGGIVTISWWRKIYNDVQESEIDAVEKAINDYIGPKIGVNVDMKAISGDYESLLTLGLASDEDIDLFWTASWDLAAACKNLIQNNAAMDLSDKIKNYPGLWGAMPESIWDSSKFNGKYYWIPIYKESAEGYSVVVPQSVIDKMGWKDLQEKIKSYKDLEPYLAEAKKKGIGMPFLFHADFGYQNFSMDRFAPLNIGRVCVVDLKGDTKKVINLAETDDFKEYLDTVYKWNKAGYIPEGEATREYQVIGDFANKEDWGFMIQTTTPLMEVTFPKNYNCGPVVAIKMTENWIHSDSAIGSVYGINQKSKKADACLKFLEVLMTDPVVADLACYGLDGVNYNRDKAGKVVRVENDDWNFGTWLSSSIATCSLLVSEPDNKVQEYLDFNNSAKTYPFAGFRFDQTPVDAVVAAVAAVNDEYWTLLNQGFLDPKKALPEYRERLKEAGIDELIAEVQKQYDEWLATK